MHESNIENWLIEKLQRLKYEYRPDIKDKDSLEQNFREKFEELNRVKLTNKEFDRLMELIITPDVFNASMRLRTITSFERDDGTPLNFMLVNIKDWCKNSFEVVNQLRINSHSSHHRYDVVLLLNGIPMVQIELKSLPVSPYKAMEQIVKYKSDKGNGYGHSLLCFLQLFIISNKSETYYFANNDSKHFNFEAEQRFLPIYQFADEQNNKINDLGAFADNFLPKCTLGETINRYMVLVATEQKMLMMRPYQIYAVKAIIDSIRQETGNGYIWHTTGSGKTLTSFKASTLLKDNPNIEKCLFVVDRKDLDKQTREEFNKFQEGSVEENTNTESLVERLLSTDYKDKVIVTTIQKLGLALDGSHKKNYKERLEPLKNKRMVFIFDECHRSQFGDNHKAIKEFFPNAQLFGFTGTPIFEENANYVNIKGQEAHYKTTKDIFNHALHEYTITHAIEDKNVLRFNVDYFKPKNNKKIKAGTPVAKKVVVQSILEKHEEATNSRKFNAIFATSSINDAIEYFRLFQAIQAENQQKDDQFKPLNIACLFSPPAGDNKDAKQLQEDLPQEQQDNEINPNEKKQALIEIIEAYNKQYGTNHKISEFDLYYQDIQSRIKDQQYSNRDLSHENKIDITIVVDMLLTGFDSKYLNTLYVDKNLDYHRLIQAFSRTNRILNNAKPFGNILDFRGQKDKVEEAIKLFSGEGNEERARQIWLVDEAPVVIDNLQKAKQELDTFMENKGLQAKPSDVPKLKGDGARSQFINLFKNVQRLKTQLAQYTDLDDKQKQEIENILPKDEHQAYKGVYITTAKALQNGYVSYKGSEETEEPEFEFVLFASEIIDYDYIMRLVADYTKETTAEKREMSKKKLVDLMAADAKFTDDRQDIEDYINSLEFGKALDLEEIKAGFIDFKAQKNKNQLNEIADKNGIEAEALQEFVALILKHHIFEDADLTELLKPLGLGWKERTRKKLELMEDLSPLLRKMAEGKEISGLGVYDDA